MQDFKPIKVYVKLNTNNEIIAINSEIFLTDLTGWIKIDEGHGDRFSHAQNHYFSKPLRNLDGTYNYKYEKGEII